MYQAPSFRMRCLSLGMVLCAMGQTFPALGAAAAESASKAPSWAHLKELRKAEVADVDLDVSALLAAQGGHFTDAVWTLAPEPLDPKTKTKEVVHMVPMRITGGGFHVGSPPVNPESGRFVAWYIPAPPAEKSEDAAIPPGAPRFAADLFVTVDHQVHWGVDRFSSTMRLNNQSSLTNEKALYVYSIDHSRLAKQRPEPLAKQLPYQKPTRNKDEPFAAYATREHAAHSAYKKRIDDSKKAYEKKCSDYQTANDKVSALPDLFSQPCPEVVYAIYYEKVRVKTGASKQDEEHGYTGYPQGKWVISGPTWNALAAFSRGTGASLKPEALAKAQETVKLLEAQVETKHPLAYRAVAEALVKSGLLNGIAEDSLEYKLAAKILQCPDDNARQVLSRGLVSCSISVGKAGLLKIAASGVIKAGEETAHSALEVAALRVLLHSKEVDTDPKRVQAVLQAMGDLRGPPPSACIDELINLLEGPKPADGPMTLARAEALAKEFNVFVIHNAVRRQAALAAVIQAAKKSPLAAVLVNKSLLGASGASLAESLAALAQAGHQAESGVPLFSPNHQLLALLASEDNLVRLAAWKALPSMRVCSLAFENKGSKGTDLPAILNVVVNAGLAAKDTPIELVDFLESHAGKDAMGNDALAGLMRVMASGNDVASAKAAEVFAKPQWVKDFASTLLDMGVEIRWKAATRAYMAKKMAAPTVVGLLLSPKHSGGLTRWFGAEFATGVLPMGIRYADQVKDDAALLDLVLAQDPHLAQAAVAALAYHEGADDEQMQAVVKQMLDKPYKLREQMERQWGECQKELFMNRVKGNQGDRVVRLASLQKGGKDWRVAEMGKVVMQWQGDEGLSLGVPRLALQPVVEKKVLLLSDVLLLDRINPKTRRELGLVDLAGAAEFSWHAPCWEAQVQVTPEQKVLIQIAPVGWVKLPPVPVYEAAPKKKK